MATVNRATQQDRDRKAITGTQKHLSNQPAILLAGVSYTPPEIVAFLEHDITLADAATNARTALLAAAAALRVQHTVMKPFLVSLKAYVENQFTDPNTIAEFGFSPRKATTPSAATKAKAVNKRAATRTARHTLGKNQKKDIHGTVASTEPVPSPVPAPSGAGVPTPPAGPMTTPTSK
jgi:hypothetical protein